MAIFTAAGSPKSASEKVLAPCASNASRIFRSNESITAHICIPFRSAEEAPQAIHAILLRFSPLFSVSSVLKLFCVQENKDLTQRTQRKEEKTGGAWEMENICDEILTCAGCALRLV